ncbi:hypothetical protein FGO68_gene366 [Halteria grandinella]|uniref:RING-type domain-containing protein n=1 Tax=Halteria grandinella TaxID=5974 RepID=A0A8J8NR26_HALGN|nr:hypothetical protein FGO68_gene366 [Halteria grandinella]
MASSTTDGFNFLNNYIEQFIQHLSVNDPNRFGPPPASKSAIEALQKLPFSSFADSKTECCVCQELFKDYVIQEGDTKAEVLQMPCTHQFHQECLIPWLEKHNTCPSCRHELPTDDAEYEQRKQARIAANPGNRANPPIQQQTQHRPFVRQPNVSERGVGFESQ